MQFRVFANKLSSGLRFGFGGNQKTMASNKEGA